MDKNRRNILKGLLGLFALGCPGGAQAANQQAVASSVREAPAWLQKLIQKEDMSKTTLYQGPFPGRAGTYTVTTWGGHSILAYPDTYAQGSQISREIEFDFKAPPTFGFKPKEADMAKLSSDEQETVALIIQKTNDVFWAARYFPDGRPTDKEVQNGETIGIFSTEIARVSDRATGDIKTIFKERGITDDKEKAVYGAVGIMVSTAEDAFERLGIRRSGAPATCNKIVAWGVHANIYHGAKNRNNSNDVQKAQELAWVGTQRFRNKAVHGALNGLKRIKANEHPELGCFSENAIKIVEQLETFGEGIIKQISRMEPKDLVWKAPKQSGNQLPSLRKPTEEAAR